MANDLNLKQIELRAFRSTYQDGLWDIYLGLVVVCMAIFIYHPTNGYTPLNIILAVVMITAAYSLFFLGKKFITVPRLGQVRFGEMRARKKRTLAIILGVFVLFQIGLVGLTTLGWSNPQVSEKVNRFLVERNASLLAVACIGSLMVGISMIVMAYFSDFLRGYYIAILMALAVFLMIFLNRPAYPIIIGGLIILPGLVLFVRFLKNYPLPQKGTTNE